MVYHAPAPLHQNSHTSSILRNGPFPNQVPVEGAHGASLLTKQYDFFSKTKPDNFS